ncbi:DUF5752 family protein [Thermodesulfobacteriota bacterium]
MNSQAENLGHFAVKDCALVSIATGARVQNLRELRDILLDIHPGCIYYHFWGGLLKPRFDDPEFRNDFAHWSHHALHDEVVAERPGIVDPTEYEDLDGLRQETIEIVEQRLDEVDRPSWVRIDKQFHFIRSQIVVFDTRMLIETPEDMMETIPNLSVGSIFYHFIDARRGESNSFDDFTLWLEGHGQEYSGL